MTNNITQQLHDGWLQKLESDKAEAIRRRAETHFRSYVCAKRVFKYFTVEYQKNGMALIYTDRMALSGLAGLKTFKQTGSYYYKHFTGHMGVYLPSVRGDKAYLEINLFGISLVKDNSNGRYE